MIFPLTSNLGCLINFQNYVWVFFDLNEHKLQVSWINNETTSVFIPLTLNAIKVSSKKLRETGRSFLSLDFHQIFPVANILPLFVLFLWSSEYSKFVFFLHYPGNVPIYFSISQHYHLSAQTSSPFSTCF